MPGTDTLEDSDGIWQMAEMKTDDDKNCVPLLLGFDMWMNYAGGEFLLKDPIDQMSITGVKVNRIHDGACGVMQVEQLQDPANCDVIDKSLE